jgi:hypothetical protein
MRTLLEDAQLWFDLEGAEGEGVDKGANFGVVGEGLRGHGGDLREF